MGPRLLTKYPAEMKGHSPNNVSVKMIKSDNDN